MNNRGLALWQALLAALSFLAGSASLAGLLGAHAAAALSLLAGAGQSATLVYLASMRGPILAPAPTPVPTYPAPPVSQSGPPASQPMGPGQV